ncbi:hypothetical protein DWW03_15790, partial [Alistipes sp. AF14-19]
CLSLIINHCKPFSGRDSPETVVILHREPTRPRKPETASYKYSFRLNEELNSRFNGLFCKAGSEQNRSCFIVKRIFGEEFVVIKRTLSKTRFVARLNDFYFQFQKPKIRSSMNMPDGIYTSAVMLMTLLIQ